MASSAAWINVGGVDLVGLATMAGATVTLTGHGLSDGDMVVFDDLGGGADGPIDAGVVYYVRGAETDTFAVSGSRGGVLVEVDAAGTAEVYAAVPSYTAEDMRQLGSHLMFHGSTRRLGARQGVRPGGGDPVTVAGSTWTVHHHTGTVDPGVTSTQGPYTYVQLETTGSLAPPDASNARLDAIDLQVQDDDADASGHRRTQVVYTTGTPSGTPAAPAALAGALRIATILVPSSGPAEVSDLALWTVASGGVLPVRGPSERPSVGRHDMMLVGRQDTGAIEAWHEGTWSTIAAVGGFQLLDRVVYTSSGTFDKTAYPGIRAVHVEVQAGGGGGGGTNATGSGEAGVGGGGGGGEYRRGWVLDAALASSTTVTVGGGGNGGSNGSNNGGSGSVSTFGAHVSCNGGGGGDSNDVGSAHLIATGGNGGSGGSGGYLTIIGADGGNGYRGGGFVSGGLYGGGSHLGGSQRGNATTGGGNGSAGQAYGGGGAAGHNNGSRGVSASGGAGAPGVVIVEVYG